MAREVVKKVKNAVLYSDGTIKIAKVRASHPHLDRPYKGKNDGENSVPKYGIVGMLPKKTHKEAKDLCVEVINQLLKDNKIKKVGSDKKFIRDGDSHDKEEYEGCWIVSAREARRPSLRDKDKSVVDATEAAELFYGGCWVTILIRPWVQNNDYGNRVNAGLKAAQFYKDGEPFGEGQITDEELDDTFDDYDDGDDDFPDDDDDDFDGL